MNSVAWNHSRCHCTATGRTQRSTLLSWHAERSLSVLRCRRTSRSKPGGCTASVIAAGLTPQLVFNTVTLAVLPMYGLMVAFPRKQLTTHLVSSPLFYAAGSLLYLAALLTWVPHGLLGNIWSAFSQSIADQQVTPLAALFQCPDVTALTWTHLLLLDLCVARHVYLDGLRKQVFTAHSIILCFMFGPTGLLSHMFTNRFAERRLQAQPSSV